MSLLEKDWLGSPYVSMASLPESVEWKAITPDRPSPPWLQSLFISLAEGIAVGCAVYFATHAGWGAVASCTVAATVFYLRVGGRVQKQVDPGDRQLLEKLTESLPGMVYQCRLSPTGHCVITYANSALGWIYEKELAGMQRDCAEIFDLVHPEDKQRVWDSLTESALNLTPWRGEYRVILPKQGTRWRFALAQVERLPDGGTLWHGFIADVTWRKEAEEDLRKSRERETEALRAAKASAEEADRLKSEFLAVVSHEIRTPMNGIIGFTELLKESRLDPSQRECVDVIEQSSERLLALINDTLDLARMESGSFEIRNQTFAVRENVEATFRLLKPSATKKALLYKLRFASDLPDTLTSDPIRLAQILTNLLGNAVKFTESGGVELLVEFRPAGTQQNSSSGEWVFTVSDTGPGIQPESLSKIFDAFYQEDSSTNRRQEGAGLGLAISHRLAKLLGGKIEVRTHLERGSSFSLRLPERN